MLLTTHCPRITLLGISTVHGNAPLSFTTSNTISVLEAINRRQVPVYPGAAKPFCREAVHAGSIHGESGLDGTTVLPAPVAEAQSHEGGAVGAMREALATSEAEGRKAWLVSTGSLTNVAYLFAVYPELADKIAGLSIMGGVVGGLFSHAPLGRVPKRSITLRNTLHRLLPAGIHSVQNKSGELAEIAALIRREGIVNTKIEEGEEEWDERIQSLLSQARSSFGNWSPWAEFNIYCDPEAAASVFSNPALARKTTLIPLDLTHQVLATESVLNILKYGALATEESDLVGEKQESKVSVVRQLFHEILTFFASTYATEFGMTSGPPLHDPIAVFAALAPDLVDDAGGERYEVKVVRGSDHGVSDSPNDTEVPENVEQTGRTVVRLLEKGEEGVSIPRTLNVGVFWWLLELSLQSAQRETEQR